VNDKIVLRRELRRQRAELSPAYRDAAAHALVRFAHRWLRRGKRLGAYVATGSEFSLEPLIHAAITRGASIYLPVLPGRGRRLWFTRVQQKDRWYLNRYKIPEYEGPRHRAERLDVLFIPLIGVDAIGHRLGQGGGFYDATLAFRGRRRIAHKPLLIGVAFECQRVPEVPREQWDMRLDGLLTERGFYRFPKDLSGGFAGHHHPAERAQED
jgi:5-formyltetrahydrofolate cyclo-ligase